MGVELEEAQSFGRASPVREYWIAHSHGFRLRTRNGRTGVVESIGYAGSLFQPEVLAVRVGRLRRVRLIPAQAVEEVVPAERLLVVVDAEAPSQEGRRRSARGAGALVRVLRLLPVLLAAAAVRTARAARRAGGAAASATAWTIPRARRAGARVAQALRAVDGRLQGPLLRLHERLAGPPRH